MEFDKESFERSRAAALKIVESMRKDRIDFKDGMVAITLIFMFIVELNSPGKKLEEVRSTLDQFKSLILNSLSEKGWE